MKTLMMITAVVALATLPNFANAASEAAGNAAAGVPVGAGAEYVIGRPTGAAIGGSGTVGAGFREARDRDDLAIEQRGVSAHQRSCARDALGSSMCEDIRR